MGAKAAHTQLSHLVYLLWWALTVEISRIDTRKCLRFELWHHIHGLILNILL